MAQLISQCIGRLVDDSKIAWTEGISPKTLEKAFLEIMKSTVVPMAKYDMEMIAEDKMDIVAHEIDDLALKFVSNVTSDKYDLRKYFWAYAKKIIDGALGEGSKERKDTKYIILLEILVRLSMESVEDLKTKPWTMIRTVDVEYTDAHIFEELLTHDLMSGAHDTGMNVKLENGTPLGQSIKKFLGRPIVSTAVVEVVKQVLEKDIAEEVFKNMARYLKFYTSDLGGQLPIKGIVVRDGFVIFTRGMAVDRLMTTCAVIAANLFANYAVMKSANNYLMKFAGVEPKPRLMDNRMIGKWKLTSPGGLLEEKIFGRQTNIGLCSPEVMTKLEKLLFPVELPPPLVQPPETPEKLPDDLLVNIPARACPIYKWPAVDTDRKFRVR